MKVSIFLFITIFIRGFKVTEKSRNAWQRFALNGSAVCYLNLNVFISKIKALFRKWFGRYS